MILIRCGEDKEILLKRRDGKMAGNESGIKGIGKKLSIYFNDVKKELKRVVWPTKRQLTINTITVLVACLLIGAIIWCSDLVFNKFIELIVSKNA